MDLLPITIIAVGLAADCFAVALGSGISRRITRFITLRTSLAFGIAQFAMALLGWLAGRNIVEIISAYAHWAAFGLLAIVGGRMLWEAYHGEEEGEGANLNRGLTLIGLSIATSIDSLAVGVGLAFLRIDILFASVIIGITTFVISLAGFFIGKRTRGLFGPYARLAGGLILIGIGLRILLSHLL